MVEASRKIGDLDSYSFSHSSCSEEKLAFFLGTNLYGSIYGSIFQKILFHGRDPLDSALHHGHGGVRPSNGGLCCDARER